MRLSPDKALRGFGFAFLLAAAYTNPSQLKYNANQTGSSSRSMASKFSDFTSVKDYGAKGDGTTDDTAAIQAAITYCQSLVGAGSVNKGGCTVYLPEGIYPVSSINLSSATSVFYRQLRLKGAGRWATTIVANSTGKIIIDMLGQNLAEISDLAIDSTSFQSQAAIFVGRSTTSTNANDNHFTDLHITGNYSKASAVCLGCESSSWTRVRFENANTSVMTWTVVPAENPKHVTFYGGDDNAQLGISSTNGTLFTNGSTDNVMTDCQFYAPYDNASLTYFHNTSAYRFLGGSWVAGTQNSVHLVTLQTTTGVFNGSMDFVGPHMEWFGTGAAIWLDPNGGFTVFKGLHFFNGFFNASGGAFIDYDRTVVANQPDLADATINSVKGNSGSSGFQIYLYALENSNIHWQPYDDNTATVTVFNYIQNSVVKSWNLFNPYNTASTGFHYNEQFAAAQPTTGTYHFGQIVWNNTPASGQPLGWIAVQGGTAGTLNGGSTTGTCTSGTNSIALNTATGLTIGQKISCGANAGQVVTAISGTTAYVTPNWTANCAAVQVFYINSSPLVPFGSVGALAPTRTALTYSGTIATDASLGNSFSITATNGTAFTISNPTNLVTGQRLLYVIRNTSGGALGAATWGATFKMATWAQPANGFSRSIEFIYDGTNLVESSRATADVPN